MSWWPHLYYYLHLLLWIKESHQSPNFETLERSDKCLMSFLKAQVSFPSSVWSIWSDIKHNSFVLFSSNIIYFGQKQPMKVQTFETSEGSDQNSPNSCHFLNNKLVVLQILHHSSVSWDITPLYFFSWSFIYFQQKASQSTNLVKFHVRMGSFYNVWAKNITEELSFMTLKWCKTWINPDLVVSKMAWGSGWTFIRALKSLKNCISMDSFCPKHLMFQLENFRGILCLDTEGWCKT